MELDSDRRASWRLPGLSLPPEAQEGWTFLESINPWILDRQSELTGIPAPPFGEKLRGERMAEWFAEVGLEGVSIDRVGNVSGTIGAARGAVVGEDALGAAERPLILSAHLDTVFPPDTPIHPVRTGERIEAPGISDDGRGLAAVLALARTLTHLPIHLPFPILFVATVGEEGPGNLRGVRHLFGDPPDTRQALGFISLDGVGLDRIIHRGVGSTRFRVTLTGQGGHSWTDFGRPNPIHALGRIVSSAQGLALPEQPKTTLTVARWGGGTSINSIPQEAWAEFDLRSESGEALRRVEEDLRRLWAEEARGGGRPVAPDRGLSLQTEEIGRRPAGATDPSAPLVRAAQEATRLLNEEPRLISSSTDSNVPMALGIPAITMGAGGVGGGIHTKGEWYEDRKGTEGILRALLTLLLLR